jgi:phosphate transport system substrate-binding protein
MDEYAITNAPMVFKIPRTKIISIDNHYPSPASVQSGDYPLSRPLLLVARGLPQGDLRKFFEFMLSVEGQKIVARYYVPVRQ